MATVDVDKEEEGLFTNADPEEADAAEELAEDGFREPEPDPLFAADEEEGGGSE